MDTQTVLDLPVQQVNDDVKADVKKIKASFARCAIEDRKLFKQSSCILPISIMGRKEHENHRFAATIKRVNGSFRSCTLLVCDTLYRHTLKIDYANHNEQQLYALALQAGEDWLARNIMGYQNIDIPHQIMRWDQYLSHPDFAAKLAIIEQLYASDETYKASVNKNVEQYLERYTSRLDGEHNFDYPTAFSACCTYLKEECAIMTIWADEGYDFEVYPTGRCLAMAATYDYVIKPVHPELLKPVGITYKNKSPGRRNSNDVDDS